VGKKKVQACLVAGFSMLCCIGEAAASAITERFSIAPYYEFYAPKLTALRDGAQKAPLYVDGEILDMGVYVAASSRVGNDLSMDGYESSPGLRLQYRIANETVLFLAFAAWKFEQGSTATADVPFQNAYNTVRYTRTNSLSFDEYALGLKQQLISNESYRLSIGAAAHKLHDIAYDERMDFQFIGGSAAGQSRYMDINGVDVDDFWGFSLFADLEKPLSKQWSLSCSAGYFYVPGTHQLNGVGAEAVTDLSFADSVSMKLPITLNPSNGKIQYQSTDGSSYQHLGLDFSGFRAAVGVSYSF
jgi:hypothetical protein